MHVCACLSVWEIWTDETIKASDLGSLICKAAVKVPGASLSSCSLSFSLSFSLSLPLSFPCHTKRGWLILLDPLCWLLLKGCNRTQMSANRLINSQCGAVHAGYIRPHMNDTSKTDTHTHAHTHMRVLLFLVASRCHIDSGLGQCWAVGSWPGCPPTSTPKPCRQTHTNAFPLHLHTNILHTTHTHICWHVSVLTGWQRGCWLFTPTWLHSPAALRLHQSQQRGT